MSGYVLAIDQGTTSTRAIVFDGEMKIAGVGQKEFTQIYPRSGWVEHDPEEIWDSVVSTIQMALREAKVKATDIAALGITNQRETVVVWERETGKPIQNAIVWQDRRTASYCENLKRQDLEKIFTRKTGLILDPYFSGTKLSWMLANVKGARARAAKGELCFGTEEVLAEAPEQERMEAWIMTEVDRGVPLPGLYPMNAETKQRYQAWKDGQK